jgi:hypothetical protein
MAERTSDAERERKLLALAEAREEAERVGDAAVIEAGSRVPGKPTLMPAITEMVFRVWRPLAMARERRRRRWRRGGRSGELSGGCRA